MAEEYEDFDDMPAGDEQPPMSGADGAMRLNRTNIKPGVFRDELERSIRAGIIMDADTGEPIVYEDYIDGAPAFPVSELEAIAEVMEVELTDVADETRDFTGESATMDDGLEEEEEDLFADEQMAEPEFEEEDEFGVPAGQPEIGTSPLAPAPRAGGGAPPGMGGQVQPGMGMRGDDMPEIGAVSPDMAMDEGMMAEGMDVAPIGKYDGATVRRVLEFHGIPLEDAAIMTEEDIDELVEDAGGIEQFMSIVG